MKRITVLALGLVVAVSAYAGGSVAVDKYSEAREVIKKENACVAKLVQTVERINIAVGNGTCWEEANGYYK